MNTLEQLLDNGIELNTAVSMLESYSNRIGTRNGIYEVYDISYDFTERGRDITLRCTQCGRKIHRIMISGRNKWSELIKSCPCEKEAKRKAESEKFFEKKKALFEEMKSRVGMEFGDYEIVSLEDLDCKPKYTLKCMTCGAEKIVGAYRAVRRKRNYQEHQTQEFIDNDMVSMYDIIKAIALYDWNLVGAEGHESISENGISRSFVDRNSILNQVVPFVQVL